MNNVSNVGNANEQNDTGLFSRFWPEHKHVFMPLIGMLIGSVFGNVVIAIWIVLFNISELFEHLAVFAYAMNFMFIVFRVLNRGFRKEPQMNLRDSLGHSYLISMACILTCWLVLQMLNDVFI